MFVVCGQYFYLMEFYTTLHGSSSLSGPVHVFDSVHLNCLGITWLSQAVTASGCSGHNIDSHKVCTCNYVKIFILQVK
jgi:hypothetical protein